jgi:hypothetical protein
MNMHDNAKVQEHFETTLAFVRERLPNLTAEVLDRMARTRHEFIVAATGVDLPFDETHMMFERVNVVYSLAAAFSWSVMTEAFTESSASTDQAPETLSSTPAVPAQSSLPAGDAGEDYGVWITELDGSRGRWLQVDLEVPALGAFRGPKAHAESLAVARATAHRTVRYEVKPYESEAR